MTENNNFNIFTPLYKEGNWKSWGAGALILWAITLSVPLVLSSKGEEYNSRVMEEKVNDLNYYPKWYTPNKINEIYFSRRL